MNTTEINEENLKAAGWKKAGCAWYNGPRKITIQGDSVWLWFNRECREIKKLDDI